MTSKKFFLTLLGIMLVLFFFQVGFCQAHLPRIVYTQKNDVKISSPENSQAFYDELFGSPRNYFINSKSEFTLYLNLLVPFSNYYGRFSANVFEVVDGKENLIQLVDGNNFTWQEFYEPFDRDYYLKGPELEKKLPAGQYRIEVFSKDNSGKYVLAVGKNEVFPILDSLSAYWVLPTLKIQFFNTPVYEFILTPFGLIAGGVLIVILIFIAFLFFAGSVVDKFKKIKPQMLLLTSSGMTGSKEDIMAILPKPADDIRVAHIITASKPKENTSYVDKDRELMRQAGFNVDEVDIEGKNQAQLLNLLKNVDIIYVQGGNTFYLLKHIRLSGFDKVLKKLLKKGVIYVGVSAGSIVAGKNIKTAGWYGDKNAVNLISLSALNLIPYNIFVHYKPEFAELIKSKSKKEKNNLKVLTDGEALFVFGKKITLVGNGSAINPENL